MAGDEGRYREHQRSGWATCVSGKKRRELFFSLRRHSLMWYKSDQLVDFKGSTSLCGCQPSLEGLLVTLCGSDEKGFVHNNFLFSKLFNWF